MNNINHHQIIQELECRFKLEQIINSVGDGMRIIDTDYNIVLMNKSLEHLSGFKQEEALGKKCYEIFSSSLCHTEECPLIRISHGEKSVECDLEKTLRDGKKAYCIITTTPLKDTQGKLLGIIESIKDITLSKENEENLTKKKENLKNVYQQLSDIIEFLPDATFVVNEKKEVIAWNRAMEDLTGTPKDKMIGRDKYAYAVPFYGKPRPMLLDLLESGKDLTKYNYRNAKKQGNTLYAETFSPVFESYLWSTAAPLYDSYGKKVGAIESMRDITDRKRMEEQLEYVGLHDLLTGLYNRTFFEKEMQHLEKQNTRSIGMIVCDIDGLKLVNDILGHDAGDRLLRNAATVLSRCFRKNDVIARIGGDEFAIILPNSSEATVKVIVNRVQEMFHTHNKENLEQPIFISIGYAFSKKAISLNELFKKADNNMYREKLYHNTSTRSAIVHTLMEALESRDLISEGHGVRVQSLVTALAEELGFSQQKITDLSLFAQFHDIGKVGIPDRILFKEGPLTTEEKDEMKRHSEIGFRIAQSSPDLLPIADWILKHHEWWNGKGYPLGIEKEDIPIECRMLAIADAYDTMTNEQTYQKAISPEDALEKLEAQAGKQFDPVLVNKFIQINKTNPSV